ncbi:MAG TPA: ectonucleotide pyrophosphatase/phosphodiesterase [Pyrinomonadaceae bacterium]|nr:ectonucleotide pyrophosphatase/phosphodiesterase [Pyrinomonadaceae bacterium]
MTLRNRLNLIVFALAALAGITAAALGGLVVSTREAAEAGAPEGAAARQGERPRQASRRVIVVSLDGLDVRYLRRADELGLRIPTLRRLMREGVTAGVVSVYPSITYPNHTAMVTGALPARHGIFGNMLFDPEDPNTERGHWFARDIKAETLWDSASRAGLTTALVSWPVAGGAGDWNAPEIWKPGGTQRDTLEEIKRHARPAGLIDEIAARDPELFRRVTEDEQDDMRTRFAEYLITEKKPALLLVHLFDLDHFEHDFGPFTPEAIAVLEKLDGYVGRLLAAAGRAGTLDETSVFVVSDHGFREFRRRIHPGVALRGEGLVKVRGDAEGADGGDEEGRRAFVSEWRAMPYVTGGSAAVVLRDPGDKDAARRARLALERAATRGGQRIFRILDAEEVRRLGSNTRAAFMLEAEPGYAFGTNLTGRLVTDSRSRGMHGYLPHPDDYRAAFVASGAGVARRGDLGTIGMTEVGPTVADLLGLSLRDAQGRPLKLR